MSNFFRVARLQNEVGTKDFLRGTNFLTKNAPKFSPKFLSLYFVGRKKSRKIPAKFPTKFPSPKSKKIHQRASAGVATLKLFGVLGTYREDSSVSSKNPQKLNMVSMSEVSLTSSHQSPPSSTFSVWGSKFCFPQGKCQL